MGVRYILYRMWHEFEKITGLLKLKHPRHLVLRNVISLNQWKTSKNLFVIPSKEDLEIKKLPNEKLKRNAEKILGGELNFFNADWINIGLSYDWITNPTTNFKYNIQKHWSEIADLSKEAGDIKYVWEKSRFSHLLILIRYDFHFDQDVSEFVFSEIESWIDSNPINQGPNWRCSQEISLRIFNWCYALYYYQNSPALTEARWNKINKVIYASLHHVYHHINFSRIAVRNNHAITETLFLSLSNILFPYIPESKKWSEKGLGWFEQEVNYQIYEDGTFLQFSMNYHRVVVQLLSFGISIQTINKLKFSDFIYFKAYKSLNFLYQCMQDENGWLPNYGSNDGALFFPLTDLDYRDYRPQINTLHKILTGNSLFKNVEINEDYLWVNGKLKNENFKSITKKFGSQSFNVGGYFLCRKYDFFTFIRCGNHKDRPAQADNLHLDIWYKNQNILRDSGTYKYNAEPDLLNYFMGSKSHNVVTVDQLSQMEKGGRFIWYFWTQKVHAKWVETDTDYIFTGEIKAFGYLNKEATHRREIRISKQLPKWIVIDNINNLNQYSKQQNWHPHTEMLKFNSENKWSRFKSYNSDYYGLYSEENSLFFEFDNGITTEIEYLN